MVKSSASVGGKGVLYREAAKNDFQTVKIKKMTARQQKTTKKRTREISGLEHF